MGQVKMAKADAKDFESVLDFLNACEAALEGARWSLRYPYDEWENLDDEDERKIELLKLRKSIAHEEGLSETDVDNRILMYEWLQQKFKIASANWRRVYFASQILIDNVCDPQLDHLAFYPGFELNHVDREQ